MTQYGNLKEARQAIKNYIQTYNFKRNHSAIDYQAPATLYYPAMLIDYATA
ncbi:IS3 family transposase [Megasphaera paucivorans]|uniref:IS3 family transposase n=1 Tax=Megasphaera paucivorans TaxID=349095 RepID=UPI001C40BA16